MTWVVGMGRHDACVVIADVAVTLSRQGAPDEEVQEFGVRKVYPVPPNLLVGFAGSIPAGLAMIDHLSVFARNRLHDTPPMERRVLVPVGPLLEDWCEEVTADYRSLPDHAQAGDCRLLVVGLHPSIAQTADDPPVIQGVLPTGIAFVVSCSAAGASAFVSEDGVAYRGRSIGSGQVVHQKVLDLVDWGGIANGPPMATALFAANSMHHAIENNPQLGISDDLLAMSLWCDPAGLAMPDQVHWDGVPWGELPKDPARLASSWDQFVGLADRFLAHDEILRAVA